MKTRALVFCALLTLLAGAAAAQQENPFDYTPAAGEQAPAQPQAAPALQLNYQDVDVVKTADGATDYIYKHRWRDWLERAIYLALAGLALLILAASLPHAEELPAVLAYFLEGAVLMIAVWLLACSATLYKAGSQYWLYVLPAGPVLAAAAWLVLRRINKADVSMEEVRKNFTRQSGTGAADPRLAPLDGRPGDWSDQDFIK